MRGLLFQGQDRGSRAVGLTPYDGKANFAYTQDYDDPKRPFRSKYLDIDLCHIDVYPLEHHTKTKGLKAESQRVWEFPKIKGPSYIDSKVGPLIRTPTFKGPSMYRNSHVVLVKMNSTSVISTPNPFKGAP